jgi:Lon protease-like protein
MQTPEIPLPGILPVMVLGGATLFPRGFMPLFIFEPRYRAMLSYALERDRMFCIGHVRAGVDPESHPDPVHRISTAGLVRACVTHPDGTSHLMLSGMCRIEIVGWEQTAPFRIASVVPRPCVIADREAALSAALELVDLTGRLCGKGQPISERLREHLRSVADPCTVADIVAQSLVGDPGVRQELLDMDDIGERLSFLVGHLSSMIASGGA